VPRLSVWLIRTGLLYLGVGFTLGALILFQKGVPYAGAVWQLLPMHIEFVLVGWTMQLAMGVGFWMLPRFIHGAARGDERLVWLAYLVLNAGVLTVGLGAWLGALGVILLLGRIAELLAALLFALHAWPRVKPHGV
jgi:heme/copper-type cytochrome/quinol oxidase subunit 1